MPGAIIRAPLRKRFNAFWIDFLVYCIILPVIFTALFLLVFDFKVVMGTMAEDDQLIFLDSFQHFLVAIQISFFIFLLRDINKGKSIGKKVIGLAVRDSRNYDKSPFIVILLLRNIFIILWPIEFLTVFIDKENRRLSDILLNTAVVDMKDAP